MNYLNGRPIVVGDLVELGGGMTGVVACTLEDGQAALGFSGDEWSDLKEGVLVQSEQAGLIHFSDPDIDLVLIRRKS
jgi:hypothetical protein